MAGAAGKEPEWRVVVIVVVRVALIRLAGRAREAKRHTSATEA